MDNMYLICIEEWKTNNPATWKSGEIELCNGLQVIELCIEEWKTTISKFDLNERKEDEHEQLIKEFGQ